MAVRTTAPTSDDPVDEKIWEPIRKLDKDLRKASRELSRTNIRSLVDFYYQIQQFRKVAALQTRDAEVKDPNQVSMWVFDNMQRFENDIKKALDEFTNAYLIGRWMKSIVGIGPVIAAGFMAHLDIRKAKTCSHFWRYAGYDPTAIWKAKADNRKLLVERYGESFNEADLLDAAKHWGREYASLLRFATTKPNGDAKKLTLDSAATALARRPWNADLKVLCFKAGDCFVKFSNHKLQYYGSVYNSRKRYEQEKNEKKEYAAQAARILEERNFNKDTEAYKHYIDGRLPPGHIHMRCQRYAVRMFMSHLHHVMFADYYKTDPAEPYPFAKQIQDHRNYLRPPNWPMVDDGSRDPKLGPHLSLSQMPDQ